MVNLEPDPPVEYPPPKTFISYSWDDAAHKEWVRQLASRLRTNGVDVTLDRWHSAPGDQIPEFMERAVRDNDFIIAVCTPRFKERSDGRDGGVGYEGDIMTAYASTKGNKRKFIPVLRRGSWEEAAPTWLLGRARIDLSGDQCAEAEYTELLRTLHGEREQAPPIGQRPDFGESSNTPANGINPVEERSTGKLKKVLRSIGKRPRLFAAMIAIFVSGIAALGFYATRSPREVAVQHDSIAYSKAAELMAQALVKGNWSGARGRLLRKEVTWDAFVHSFEPTSCVIQPAEHNPKYSQQRARVSFLTEQKNRHYVKGEQIKISGIVGEFDEHGTDIVAAIILEK